MMLKKTTRLGAIGILLSTAAFADGHMDAMSAEDLLPLARRKDRHGLFLHQPHRQS